MSGSPVNCDPSQSSAGGSPSTPSGLAAFVAWLQALRAVFSYVGLTCLFVVLTWLTVSSGTGSESPVDVAAEHYADLVDPHTTVYLQVISELENANVVRRLGCAALISFIGFCAGAGAREYHPIRSVLLAVM